MSWTELSPVLASAAMMIASVVSSMRSQSVQEQRDLIALLHDRVAVLESQITDLQTQLAAAKGGTRGTRKHTDKRHQG